MLSIFDLQGKIHLRQSISESTSIPINLNFGTYLAVIGNGQMYHVQKIIIK